MLAPLALDTTCYLELGTTHRTLVRVLLLTFDGVEEVFYFILPCYLLRLMPGVIRNIVNLQLDARLRLF